MKNVLLVACQLTLDIHLFGAQHAHRNETHALDNWRAKMIERKRIQGHISKLLNKSPGELVQSSADTYRARQEQRDVIDRAIPSIDYGKG